MLKENIRLLRKEKGLSQEELAIKLNVVRQTVSKWEQGLSVPDAQMLIEIADVLETSVSTLLGETVDNLPTNNVKAIAEKLEVINLQLSQRKQNRLKTIRGSLLALCLLIIIIFILLMVFDNAYLAWDLNNPETAVMATGLHAIEWAFVRIAPFVLLGAIVGIIITYRKK